MEAIDTIETEIPVKKENKELTKIYESTFPVVAAFISRAGGTYEEARDTFHDALIIYYEMNDHTEIYKSPVAYILGISKHLWIRKSKKKPDLVPLNEWESKLGIPEDYFPEPDNNRILSYLEKAGQKCLDLLRAFYYQGLSMSKIAKKLGYSNVHTASVQKYKCLEKVRNYIKEKSLSYEDFAEHYPVN